jgi:hypothetical protein
MKRVLPFMFMLLLLTGCGAGTTTPEVAAPYPATTSTPETAGTAAETIPAAAPQTQQILPSETPHPTAIIYETGCPPITNDTSSTTLTTGIMAVANEQCVFFYNIKNREEGEYVYSHDVIYRMDRKSGETIVIRETDENTMILNLFLDSFGNLFYLCDQSQSVDYQYTLYKLFMFEPEKNEDMPILTDLYSDMDMYFADNYEKTHTCIIGEYDNAIYYMDPASRISRLDLADNTTHSVIQTNVYSAVMLDKYPVLVFSVGDASDEETIRAQQLFIYDLTTGKEYKVADFVGEYRATDDGRGLLVSNASGTKTKLDLIDFENKTRSSFEIPAEIGLVSAIMKNGSLIVMAYDSSGCEIYNIRITTGKISIDAKIGNAQDLDFSNGKWYIYSYEEKKPWDYDNGNAPYVNQKIRVFDLAKGKLATVKTLPDCGVDDGQCYTFEVSGGYAFMIDYYWTSNCNEIWKRFKLPG